MKAMSIKDMCLLYDKQFNQKMKIAKFLVKNLPDKKEMELAKKWLIRVSNIKSVNLEVKKNRNEFLSYMLKVLGDGILPTCLDSEPEALCDPDDCLSFLHDPDGYSHFCEENDDDEQSEEASRSNRIKFHSRWSKDHRSYVAVQPIPGRGALVYLATSKTPGLASWDFPAKKKYNNEK